MNDLMPFRYSRETLSLMVITATAKNQEGGLKVRPPAASIIVRAYCANVPCCNSRSVC
jgi:hypothetical protein